MQKLAFIAGVLAILSSPALAGSANDKPMVLAEEGGISVHIGEHGDRDRDRDHHRLIVVHHHDEEEHEHHHRVIIVHHHDDDEHEHHHHHDHDEGDHH